MYENQAPPSSHPWIAFALDLGKLSHSTWIALGECASKCEHIVQTHLRPSTAKSLHLIYLAKGVQATTAIEGNTLTEEQVKLRLENRLILPPSKEYLGREVDNIIAACNRIGQDVREGATRWIGVELLCEYNQVVLGGLPLAEGIAPGQLRKVNVGVAGYRAPNHDCVPGLVDRFCQWLGGWDSSNNDLDPAVAAILKAIVAHLYIAWIHPFGDGNGRTARLVELDILLRSGIPSPAAHLLSNHYNATRSEYYRQLDLASQDNNPAGFIAYAVEGFRDGLREQLDIITDQVRDIVWRNYVHETFKGMESSTARRRRHVVLDISLQGEPVGRMDVPTLTPRLRRAYMKKTDKTLIRDLNKLVEMGLLIVESGRYSANRSVIEAFLPLRRT